MVNAHIANRLQVATNVISYGNSGIISQASQGIQNKMKEWIKSSPKLLGLVEKNYSKYEKVILNTEYYINLIKNISEHVAAISLILLVIEPHSMLIVSLVSMATVMLSKLLSLIVGAVKSIGEDFKQEYENKDVSQNATAGSTSSLSPENIAKLEIEKNVEKSSQDKVQATVSSLYSKDKNINKWIDSVKKSRQNFKPLS